MKVKIGTRIGRVNYLSDMCHRKLLATKFIFSSHLLFGGCLCIIAVSQANQAGIHG